MLTLKMIEMTSGKVVYGYYPEDESEYGIISANIRTGEMKVEKIAENDKYRRYLSHAMSRLEELVQNSTYENKVTVAWC